MMNEPSLRDMVIGVVDIDHSAPAMECGKVWWTWGELRAVMDALDAALAKAGLGRGARIATMMRNRCEVAGAIIGLTTGGRCIVTLNPALPDARLAADIESLQAPAVVGSAQDWARPEVHAAARAIGCLGLELTGDKAQPLKLVAGLEAVTGADLRREAPGVAVEMMTSGTTGTPKRMPLKDVAILQSVVQAGVYDKRRPGDPPRLRNGTQILNAPFAHISGIFQMLNCVASGRKSCLLERFTVENWVDAVRRHRPPSAGAPPSALRMIMDANVAKEDLESLMIFRTSTAPLDPDLADAFHEKYGIPVLQNYGATEFGGGIAGWTYGDFQKHHKDKRGAVGRLDPGAEGRVVDAETGEVLPLGQQGLLELRAKHLGEGGGWLRTTDLAVLDADNFLWIKGRADNAIIRGGFKVFPDDVVKALEAHPAIREAAVASLPDERLGQAPVAAYIVKAGQAGPSEDELRGFLKDRLLPYQIPTQMKAVAELPRTPSLKVSQPELRKLFA